MRKINRPACPNPRALATNYKHPVNKQVLIEASFNKCMYCESKITHIEYGDIEHIKPKKKYPDLEFDWNNLGLVCSKCNTEKLDKYNEETPYINPYDELPENHLVALGSLIMHKNGSERGELTINDINLNRADLIERRSTRIKSILKAIDCCFRTKNAQLKQLALEELMGEALEDKEYSFFVDTLFKLHGLNKL